MKLFKNILLLVGCLSLLAACSADSDTHDIPDVELGTLDLIISDRAARAVKLPGDPGTGHSENSANWNRLVLMMVYETQPKDGKTFRTHTLTNEEFKALPTVGDSDYRQISLDVPLGKVYLYGLTYTAEAKGAAELEQDIDAIAAISPKSSRQDIKSAIEGLTLTNDYAQTIRQNNQKEESNSNRVSMFLSVATGYYTENNGEPALLTITTNRNPGDNMPSMQLSRLATKLDVQWDAQDAFGTQGKESVKSVKVNKIELLPGNDNATIPTDKGSGSGRLFPQLAAKSSNILMGTFTFENTNPISQRNGRMDLYLFPDGVSVPKLIYHISGTKNDGTSVEGTYAKVLQETDNAAPAPLLSGAWYKVNTYIKGLGGLTEISTQTAQ